MRHGSICMRCLRCTSNNNYYLIRELKCEPRADGKRVKGVNVFDPQRTFVQVFRKWWFFLDHSHTCSFWIVHVLLLFNITNKRKISYIYIYVAVIESRINHKKMVILPHQLSTCFPNRWAPTWVCLRVLPRVWIATWSPALPGTPPTRTASSDHHSFSAWGLKLNTCQRIIQGKLHLSLPYITIYI